MNSSSWFSNHSSVSKIGIVTLLSVIAGGITYLLSDKRKQIVKIAQKEIGLARTKVYWLDTLEYDADKEWCGSFILWVYHQAKIGLGIKWIPGVGFLDKLSITFNPKIGDVAYFDKNQHQALISKIDGEMISLINGNGWNGVVSTSITHRSNITAFYSIERLIK